MSGFLNIGITYHSHTGAYSDLAGADLFSLVGFFSFSTRLRNVTFPSTEPGPGIMTTLAVTEVFAVFVFLSCKVFLSPQCSPAEACRDAQLPRNGSLVPPSRPVLS